MLASMKHIIGVIILLSIWVVSQYTVVASDNERSSEQSAVKDYSSKDEQQSKTSVSMAFFTPTLNSMCRNHLQSHRVINTPRMPKSSHRHRGHYHNYSMSEDAKEVQPCDYRSLIAQWCAVLSSAVQKQTFAISYPLNYLAKIVYQESTLKKEPAILTSLRSLVGDNDPQQQTEILQAVLDLGPPELINLCIAISGVCYTYHNYDYTKTHQLYRYIAESACCRSCCAICYPRHTNCSYETHHARKLIPMSSEVLRKTLNYTDKLMRVSMNNIKDNMKKLNASTASHIKTAQLIKHIPRKKFESSVDSASAVDSESARSLHSVTPKVITDDFNDPVRITREIIFGDKLKHVAHTTKVSQRVQSIYYHDKSEASWHHELVASELITQTIKETIINGELYQEPELVTNCVYCIPNSIAFSLAKLTQGNSEAMKGRSGLPILLSLINTMGHADVDEKLVALLIQESSDFNTAYVLMAGLALYKIKQKNMVKEDGVNVVPFNKSLEELSRNLLTKKFCKEVIQYISQVCQLCKAVSNMNMLAGFLTATIELAQQKSINTMKIAKNEYAITTLANTTRTLMTRVSQHKANLQTYNDVREMLGLRNRGK